MAAVVDFATGQPRRARRRTKRSAPGDAELLELGDSLLRARVAWSADDGGSTPEQQEASWCKHERRVDALCDRFWRLDPTTLAGLAMMMRVEFADANGARWAEAAMLRPTGPTKAEMAEVSDSQTDMLWRFIDYLERIAGLREPTAPKAGA